MISFDTSTHRFNLRAAAIIHRGNSILLHRLENDEFWSLPGGRVEPGEDAASALVRELHEELGIEAKVGRLSILVENFFPSATLAYHELGLYFHVDIEPDGLPDTEGIFRGREGDKTLLFRWFPNSDFAALDIRPSVLKQYLVQRTPDSFTHVVHRASCLDGAQRNPGAVHSTA
ncbi:NUDIX hydrolase [Chitinimonas sp.]|uniref:NUDIX hydrolase n=1 Tax=Chitinimonas sp. TaxID=1934313 RepID=UPI0035ADC33B